MIKLAWIFRNITDETTYMDDFSQHVPPQEQGTHKTHKHSITTEDIEDAEDFFLIAKDRLLDINGWGTLAGAASASFQLTDLHGHEAHRKAHTGDHIRINIPGPGSQTGDGYDWVRIETIAYDDYPDESSESITMRVRPSANPTGEAGDVAHFFKDAATSTFIVERHGKILAAHYYGRNEVPNTAADSLMDKARNVAVATGAMLGLSDVQWKNLVKGLLDFDNL